MTTIRRTPIAAALAALALLAPAAVADAARPRARPRPAPAARAGTTRFRLTAVGSGTFSAKGDAGGTAFEERATFRWEITLPRVAFRDGELVGAEIGHVSVRGRASERHTSATSLGQSWERCEGTRLADHGMPEIGADDLVIPLPGRRAPAGKQTLILRPFDQLTFKTDCVDAEGDRYGGELPVSSSHGQPLDVGSEDFDSFFDLPADALDKGKIIQLTRSQDAKRTKACRERTGASSCSFSWRQEITLRAIRSRSARR
jgi:hypothetical protein